MSSTHFDPRLSPLSDAEGSSLPVLPDAGTVFAVESIFDPALCESLFSTHPLQLLYESSPQECFLSEIEYFTRNDSQRISTSLRGAVSSVLVRVDQELEARGLPFQIREVYRDRWHRAAAVLLQLSGKKQINFQINKELLPVIEDGVASIYLPMNSEYHIDGNPIRYIEALCGTGTIFAPQSVINTSREPIYRAQLKELQAAARILSFTVPEEQAEKLLRAKHALDSAPPFLKEGAHLVTLKAGAGALFLGSSRPGRFPGRPLLHLRPTAGTLLEPWCRLVAIITPV